MTDPSADAATSVVVLTPTQVREKTFSSTRFKPGYDEDEVDAFLDEVEQSLVLLHQEITALRDRLTVAETAAPAPVLAPPSAPAVVAPPAPAPVAEEVSLAASPSSAPGTSEMEEMLRRTLMLAQRTADQAVAEARDQADQTLAEARQEAQRVVTDARGRAEAAEREAAARSTALISESDTQRRAIEAKVEALRAFEREYRSRLRAYFELQLRDLEGIGTPAGAVLTPTGESPSTAVPVPDEVPPAPIAVAPVPPAPEEPIVLPEPVSLPEPAAPEPPATSGSGEISTGTSHAVPPVPGLPVTPPIPIQETTFAEWSGEPEPPTT